MNRRPEIRTLGRCPRYCSCCFSRVLLVRPLLLEWPLPLEWLLLLLPGEWRVLKVDSCLESGQELEERVLGLPLELLLLLL